MDYPTLVKEWLQRSGTLPLYIRFTFSPNNRDPLPPVAEVVAPFLRRYVYANLTIPVPVTEWDITVTSIWTLLAEPTRIRHLDLTVPLQFFNNGSSVGRSAGIDLPNVDLSQIRNFSLYQVQYRYRAVANTPVLSQFHGEITMIDFLEILRWALRLEKCVVELGGEESPGTTHIVHHSLTYLEASYGDWSCDVHIVYNLTLPRLTYLGYSSRDNFTTLQYTSFITRSGCQLDGFALDTDSVGDTILPLLESASSITSLTLFTNIDTLFIDQFASSESFLTNLRSLYLKTTLDFPWSSLLSMFLHRGSGSNVPHRPLRAIRLEVDCGRNHITGTNLNAETAREVIQAIEGGLKLTITTRRDGGHDLIKIWRRSLCRHR